MTSEPGPGRPPAACPLEIRHIVVTGQDDHPSAANGVHNVARQLVREQRAAGHDARLLLLAYGDPASDGLDEVETVRIAGLSLRGRTFLLRRRVIDALLDGASARSFVHIHGGREPLLLGLSGRLQALGIPYAVTVHGRYSHVYGRNGATLKRSTSLYLEWLERRMLTGASFVQALSGLEAEILRRVAPSSRIEVLGNGAYSSRLGPRLGHLSERTVSVGYPHFVFCGRYAIHHKGLDLLLRGFALFRHRGGAGKLTTIGSGAERRTVQALAAELGLGDSVSIEGPRFGPDRDSALQACDFFVMPSRYEGLPLAALEAAAAGLPLIVTAETGLADAVRSSGAGVPIVDLSAEAVAAAFEQAAAQDPAGWAGHRSAAHRLARLIGDWSHISDRLCDLYRRTAIGHRQ